MRISILIFVCAVFLSPLDAEVRAQQPNAADFENTFKSSFQRAQEVCKALWSERAFDPLRDKIPLGDEKPTFAMLKNTEKLKARERPLAELAIKTLEKCRAAYADVYATLPPQVSAMIHGVERRQDAIIAEIYRGKLTFGEFNVSMNRLNGELSSALSGVQTTQPASALRDAPNAAASATRAVQQPKIEQKDNGSVTFSRETRLALVIGNSGYINLPKLSNPTNDARAVADVLAKMGYQTRLLLDAPEQKIRREIRQFAGDSAKADVGLVFYAGHGAQVNGNNYLLPIDMDSQYRIGYEWLDHKADVVQTQTPINPGNSGGPLISETGSLIGVNSFGKPDAQGLNFSVSVDEVKRFIARNGDRPAHSNEAAEAKPICALKEISKFRNKKNNATIVAYDTKCAGRANANYIVPDSKTESIMYTIDRNDDGRPDVIFFDLKQQKKWDISFWDEKFEGHWTLVGYHPDGKITPSSFESYDKFQSRVANR